MKSGIYLYTRYAVCVTTTEVEVLQREKQDCDNATTDTFNMKQANCYFVVIYACKTRDSFIR